MKMKYLFIAVISVFVLQNATAQQQRNWERPNLKFAETEALS